MCVGCQTEDDLIEHSRREAEKMLAEGKVIYAHVNHKRNGHKDNFHCPVCGLDAYTADAVLELVGEEAKMVCGMCEFVSVVDAERVEIDGLAFGEKFDNFEAYCDRIENHIMAKVEDWLESSR